MPSQVLSSVENNFTKGLVTEFTGMNFPENAATDCDNVEFTLVGDVTRRLGIAAEQHFTGFAIPVIGDVAKNTYVWNNAGGDGNTKLLVRQNANTLYFYKINTVTTASSLSLQQLITTVDFSVFSTGSLDITQECTFADGNGYLFVYQPTIDPFYCTFSSNTITANRITVQIRDFTGVVEINDPPVVSNRPSVLHSEHQYNLNNQGWSKSPPWSATSTTSQLVTTGSKVFTVAAGMTITNGTNITVYNQTQATPGGKPVPPGTALMTGSVTGYSGTSLTLNIAQVNAIYGPIFSGSSFNNWNIVSGNDYITAWNTAIGNYPSNSDVWWYFKNNSNVFDPATTIGNVTLSNSQAPSGHYVLNAFAQLRSLVSSVGLITDITTIVRPKVGAWFQGRVWYAGVDATQAATNNAAYYTWTENIYFSQIVQTVADFGLCYQNNDPTSENLFDLLPTDGGVIQIQGCGSINKLFPIQNGMLVFATNGIWFITGSQGIGFSANDYTITKISNVQSISPTSFVNVNGLPYFWNEEGIYAVQPSKGGGLEVNPLTVGTILSFYNSIPFGSKKYARGDYHPIDYVIQWTYKSTNAVGVFDRYDFDRILNYNTYNKAFFPYSLSIGGVNNPLISGVNYISYPQTGSNIPEPGFKYPASYFAGGTFIATFAEEYDTSYTDWRNIAEAPYDSYFVTGYKLHGQGQRRFQLPYIYVYSRNDDPTQYKIQGLWDYATTGNSGRWSMTQLIVNDNPDFGVVFRRHRIRGQGLVLQIKVSSVDGEPFDIIGWSAFETQNTGV